MTELLADCDHFIAGAALIGGISYFHTYAYDLLATNERIIASQCDAAIEAHRSGQAAEGHLPVQLSMVFESTEHWPSKEGDERQVPPPLSSYGFQKLAVEYFARAAWDQYQLPYTIVRPFNCVGIGEGRALGDVEIVSGNVKLAMSHVVPDLVQKVVKGQDPLHILGDGTRSGTTPTAATWPAASSTCMEHPDAASTTTSTSPRPSRRPCRELAEVIWRKIKGDAPFRTVVSDPAFEHDVQKRVPDVDEGPRGAGLRGDDLPGRDARRGHPLDHPGRRRRAPLSEGAPSMNEATDDRLAHQQKVWESWAQADPLWAILSDPARRGRRWDVDEFFATGKPDVDEALAQAGAARAAGPARPGARLRLRGGPADSGARRRVRARRRRRHLRHDDRPRPVSTTSSASDASTTSTSPADLALFEPVDGLHVLDDGAPARPAGDAATYITEFVRLLAPVGPPCST